MDATTTRSLMTTAQAAEFLGLADQTLRVLRLRGNGPKYCAFGRAVRYRPEDLEEFVARHTRTSTSEKAAA